MEPRRLADADLLHFDEEQGPDPPQRQKSNPDPDPHNRQKSDPRNTDIVTRGGCDVCQI
jgi:hypothetical protein